MPKTAYNMRDEIVEGRDTLEETILVLVELWHEADIPEAFIIRDEDQLIAATVAPVGSDTAVVVYTHGQIDKYEAITYHRQAGKIVYTSARYNGSTLDIMIKDGRRIA